MFDQETTPPDGRLSPRRRMARRILAGLGAVLAATIALWLVVEIRERGVRQKLVGVWTRPAGPGVSKDLLEFRADGLLHDYAPGERDRSTSFMGWHLTRSRLVVTDGKPNRATTLGGRFKHSARMLGARLELYYVARWSIDFHGDGSITLVPHSGDAGDKAVTLIRVGDAPVD